VALVLKEISEIILEKSIFLPLCEFMKTIGSEMTSTLRQISEEENSLSKIFFRIYHLFFKLKIGPLLFWNFLES
jgi:hypothetical protein